MHVSCRGRGHPSGVILPGASALGLRVSNVPRGALGGRAGTGGTPRLHAPHRDHRAGRLPRGHHAGGGGPRAGHRLPSLQSSLQEDQVSNFFIIFVDAVRCSRRLATVSTNV